MNISKKKMTLIGQIFPKLWTPKNMAKSMYKRSCFYGSFGKQHGKRAKTLLKFEWEHLYHICWSLWRRLTCKKFVLVLCKISRPFPNTLSAEGKYSLLNWDNLMQPIRMQISQKQETFFSIFYWSFEIWFKFWKFSKTRWLW